MGKLFTHGSLSIRSSAGHPPAGQSAVALGVSMGNKGREEENGEKERALFLWILAMCPRMDEGMGECYLQRRVFLGSAERMRWI